MSVYKRFNGTRVKRGSKDYDKATWYYRFKIRGRLYHQSIPEAQTQEDAKRAETAVKEKIFNNRFNPQADKTTFSEFVESVYIPYAEEKNASFDTKKLHCDKLKSRFGKTFLREITPQDVRNYQKKRKSEKKKDGEQISPATVNRELTTLSKIFSLAIQEELIERNPCSFVTKLKESDPRDRLLTTDEEKRFWVEVVKDDRMRQIVSIAINTGLRRGQILAITVQDIDFENGLLKVIASKGRPSRTIPVNNKALNVLIEAADGKTEHIFTSRKNGDPLLGFKKNWAKMLDDANIKNFRFHDLRHLFASNLMRQNVHPVIIKDLLGHSEIKMSERYMNTDFDLLSSAVNRSLYEPPIEETDSVN